MVVEAATAFDGGCGSSGGVGSGGGGGGAGGSGGVGSRSGNGGRSKTMHASYTNVNQQQLKKITATAQKSQQKREI